MDIEEAVTLAFKAFKKMINSYDPNFDLEDHEVTDWRSDIYEILTKEKSQMSEYMQVIEFVYKNDYWRSKVLNPFFLRINFKKIRQEMNAKRKVDPDEFITRPQDSLGHLPKKVYIPPPKSDDS